MRWNGAPVDARDAPRASATCPRSAACTRRCASATSSSTSPGCTASADARRAAAADRWIERLGLAERAGDRVETLSLGNQQRVQLAAALVHDPELLVLDEPFSGLDPVGVDVLAGVLREHAGTGVPVVFSSHQLELVERLCEAVAIIKDGRLVAAAASTSCARAGRATSVRVEVLAARTSWLDAVPGAEVRHRAAPTGAARGAARRRDARRRARRRTRAPAR